MKKIFTLFFAFLITLSFNSEKSNAQNNVLLEYFTGAWCQFCPCGHSNIEGILANYPNTVVLGYHGGGPDPWAAYSGTMISRFPITGYPQGVIGRRSGVVSRDAYNNEVVLQTLLVQPGVSIEVINKSYDANTRTVNANVKITALMDLTGDYFINYVLTESNMIYPQTGNGGCPGNTNYVHKHVVKSFINGELGELLNSGTMTTGTEIIRNLNYVVPVSPQIEVPENCDLNIFVYKSGASISTTNHVQQAMRTPLTGATGITNNNSAAPKNYTLTQNYPNPFNPTTNFSFSIPTNENVSLKIYDILGNVVDTYVDGFLNAGTYSVVFDGNNLSSGIYFYTLNTGSFSETKRMVLTK